MHNIHLKTRTQGQLRRVIPREIRNSLHTFPKDRFSPSWTGVNDANVYVAYSLQRDDMFCGVDAGEGLEAVRGVAEISQGCSETLNVGPVGGFDGDVGVVVFEVFDCGEVGGRAEALDGFLMEVREAAEVALLGRRDGSG